MRHVKTFLVVTGVAVSALLVIWLTSQADTEADHGDAQPQPPPTAPVEIGPPVVQPADGEPVTTPPAEAPFQPPIPTAADQRADERLAMVDRQIARSPDGRIPVTNEKVLQAMRAVPRHAFVPDDLQTRAYDDSPLPIGFGQTISQPYIVALMTELLELTPQHKVLEIGTGSGYQAAVLAQLTAHVYSIDIIQPLAQRAHNALRAQGYGQVRCAYGDGYYGWQEHGPYDAIIVTCASGHLPPPLWDQLKPGGRIVIPIGAAYEVQRLVVITKTAEGERESRSVLAVRFVPITGPARQPQ